MSIFSIGISTLRISNGFFNGDDFARLADINPVHYCRMERGEDDPTIEDLVSISYLTGKSIDYLVTGKDFDVVPDATSPAPVKKQPTVKEK